jgi:hypothetical protein
LSSKNATSTYDRRDPQQTDSAYGDRFHPSSDVHLQWPNLDNGKANDENISDHVPDKDSDPLFDLVCISDYSTLGLTAACLVLTHPLPNLALLSSVTQREIRTTIEANIHEVNALMGVQKYSFFLQVQVIEADTSSFKKNSAKHFASHNVTT